MMLVRPYLEGYDEDDPRTWPEGPARDEALELKAWIAWNTWGEREEYEALPDFPEKAEWGGLVDEMAKFEAWLDAADIQTVRDDVEHNEWGCRIEARLKEIDRLLKRRMPKRAEQKLAALLETEAREAEREFELYEQIA